MSSLDRLIDLARQTGDRLIVHDPIESRDIVIMDVDEYEKLVFNRKEKHHDVCGMSGEQMLDQINRDIAVWRANKELDERWEREEQIEDELDRVWRNGHGDEWQSAGSVLRDRYAERFGSEFHEDVEDEEENGEEDFDPSVYNQFGADSFRGDSIKSELTQSEEEIKIDDISDSDPLENPSAQVYLERSRGTQDYPSTIAQGKEEPKNIPYQNFLGETEWKEEPLLEEEPVFYEEPV